MYIKKSKLEFICLFIIVMFLVSISSITIAINSSKEYIEYLWLAILPSGFGLISICLPNIYMYFFKNIGMTILISLYFFRLVIIPMFMSFGNYNAIATNLIIHQKINGAIILMLYEFLAVALTINYTIKKYNFNKSQEQIHKINQDKKYSGIKKFKYILIPLLLVSIGCIIVYPQLKYHFKFIILNEDLNLKSLINLHMTKNTVPGSIYWVFAYLIDIIRIFIPILILIFIKKNSSKYYSEKTAVFISIITVLLFTLFVTHEYAITLQISLALFISIIFLYPCKSRIVSSIILFTLIPISFFSLASKTGFNGNDLEEIFKEISSITQAYFTGPSNVAAALNMHSGNRVLYFIGDLFKNIAFIGTLFSNFPTTSSLFNFYVYNNVDVIDQIVPLVGQGYFYFGFALAPILSCIVSFLTIRYDYKFRIEENYIKKYSYSLIFIILSLTPVAYNFSILIMYLSKILLPVYIINIILEKNQPRNNVNTFNTIYINYK